MQEIRYNNAIIRIHGANEPPRLKEATVKFLKKVEQKQRKNDFCSDTLRRA